MEIYKCLFIVFQCNALIVPIIVTVIRIKLTVPYQPYVPNVARRFCNSLDSNFFLPWKQKNQRLPLCQLSFGFRRMKLIVEIFPHHQ